MPEPARYTAPLVPDPTTAHGVELRDLLTGELGPPRKHVGPATTWDCDGAVVVLTSTARPQMDYLLVTSRDATTTDRVGERLQRTIRLASIEDLRRQALADRSDAIGWLQLWAVASLGETRAVELEDVIWDRIGSAEFIDRLHGAEAGYILGSWRALLAVEIAALVEPGPIRQTFESYLAGSSRRSLARERRYLLDPSADLRGVVGELDRTLSGMDLRSHAGGRFGVLEWISREHPRIVYLVDSDDPRLRYVGVSSVGDDELDLPHIDLRVAFDASADDPAWLRAAGNAIRPDAVDSLRALVERAFDASEEEQRVAVFAAIESGAPVLRDVLRSRLQQLDDPDLRAIVEAASLGES